MEQRLTIVVPVYNEAENFPHLWAELRAAVKSDYEALVVYDFDGDTTVPVVRRLIDGGERRLRLVKNRVRRGVAGAVQAGFAAAGAGPVLVVMADLSDDLGLVDRMVELYRSGYQVVSASRYMRGGRIVGGPAVKKTLSRLAGVSLYRVRGLPTHDATNAFKLYDAGMLKTMQLKSTAGFEINLEITVKAFLGGYRITEIPATWRDRTRGQSRFRLWAWLPRYLKWYLHAFRPRRTRPAAATAERAAAEDALPTA